MKTIVPVKTKKDLKEFIDFPHDLYAGDPNYVPELFIAQRDLLSPSHPFRKHSSLQTFLLYDGKKVIGRIAAILNTIHNEVNKVNDGFFGFFDCINDKESAKMLFDAATAWLKDNGVTDSLIGPVNFSTNEICGLLIEGFDTPPMVMMPYNAPYYPELLEAYGLHKKVDLISYRWIGDSYDDRSVKLMDKLLVRLERNNITIRKVNMKDFKGETEKIREVYNKAWDKNTGFVPLTDAEFDYQAKDMKLILDPDFCLVAEKEGKIIGFGLALPDINQVLIKIKRGRLLPTGIFKLLLNKKKVTGLRILLLGVVDGYRKMGIEACIYASIIKSYKSKGLKYADAGWILEHNDLMNSAIKAINGEPYKKYRFYVKTI